MLGRKGPSTSLQEKKQKQNQSFKDENETKILSEKNKGIGHQQLNSKESIKGCSLDKRKMIPDGRLKMDKEVKNNKNDN